MKIHLLLVEERRPLPTLVMFHVLLLLQRIVASAA